MEGLICGTSSGFMEPIYDFKELESYGQRIGSPVNQPGICIFRCEVELDSSQEYFVITDKMKYRVTIASKIQNTFEAFIIDRPTLTTTQ